MESQTGRPSASWQERPIASKRILMVILLALILGLTGGQYYGNPESMLFPGPVATKPADVSSRSTDSTEVDSELSRSLELAQRLNAIDSPQDFLQMVMGVPDSEKSIVLGSRFAETGAKSNAEHATPAKCMPEMQPVPLKQEIDPSTIYYPSCTRLMRCGGCCSHSLLACQPTQNGIEIRNFEVIVTKVDDRMGLQYQGKRIVPLEEHTKCKCDCRIKPEDCTEKQSYLRGECRCVCNNSDEEQKCLQNNETKLWDPDLCTCLCRTVHECSTGYYFDQNTCRCDEKK